MRVGCFCVVLAAVVPLFSQLANAKVSGPLPEKVTLLVDSELPVPFAVVDSFQPVRAGTEVNVKGVSGGQVRIAYGVGEGLVSMQHTDFAERAERLSRETPMPEIAPPQYYKPYDRDIVVDRVIAEEVEQRQAKAAEEQRTAEEQERELRKSARKRRNKSVKSKRKRSSKKKKSSESRLKRRRRPSAKPPRGACSKLRCRH